MYAISCSRIEISRSSCFHEHQGTAPVEAVDDIVEVQPCERALLLQQGEVPNADLDALDGQVCRELQTRDDGACAIHAAFGHVAARRKLCCPQPRELLRRVLDKPWGVISAQLRPHGDSLGEGTATIHPIAHSEGVAQFNISCAVVY